MRMYIHIIHTYVHIHSHIYVYLLICVQMSINMYIHPYFFKCKYMCTYAHTRIHTHTHKLMTHAPPLQRCVHTHADRQTSDKDSSSSDSSSSCIVRRPPRRRCTKWESACIPVFHACVLNNEDILAICSLHGERGIASRPLRSGKKKVRLRKTWGLGKSKMSPFWGANNSWHFKA